MKPRQRLEQSQSSRMYLRKKDHRDCIMENKYHNAIWMKKEQNGVEKDELVWCKYPRESLIVGTGGTRGWFGWYDTERQFQFGEYLTGTYLTVWQFDKSESAMISACNNNSGTGTSSSYYITTDGITWKKIKNNPLSSVFTFGRYFGNYGACYYSSISNGTYYVYVSTPTYNEETEQWNFENQTFTINGANGNELIYICNTNEGAIFLEIKSVDNSGVITYDAQYVRIDGNGNRTLGEHKIYSGNDARPTRSYRGWDNCKANNICCHISYDRVYTDSSGWVYRLVIVSTDDYGETIHETIIKQFPNDFTYDMFQFAMFARNNTFYLVYSKSQDKDAFIYKSEDGVIWSEVYVPNWIDVEYITDGGIGVRHTPTDKETMRIAVKATQSSDYDVTLYDMLSRANGGYDVKFDATLNKTSYGIMFKNGKLIKQEDAEFFAVFGHPNSGWMAYFDNEYLASSAKSCGWYGVSESTVSGYADTLKENDYCVRNVSQQTEIESEVE